MTGALIMDPEIQKQVEVLAPHYDIFSTSRPGVLNGHTSLPKPVVSRMVNWFSKEKRVIH